MENAPKILDVTPVLNPLRNARVPPSFARHLRAMCDCGTRGMEFRLVDDGSYERCEYRSRRTLSDECELLEHSHGCHVCNRSDSRNDDGERLWLQHDDVYDDSARCHFLCANGGIQCHQRVLRCVPFCDGPERARGRVFGDGTVGYIHREWTLCHDSIHSRMDGSEHLHFACRVQQPRVALCSAQGHINGHARRDWDAAS